MTQATLNAATVLAIAAHPDDVEFMMAGTLRLLIERGWSAHIVALANGYAGSTQGSVQELVLTREQEAAESSKVLGAEFHRALTNDSEIIYGVDLIRRVTAIIRECNPAIVLTHALDDYMEDHIETARIVSTAAFNRGMPNYQSLPPVAAVDSDVRVYHALPHGLRSQMRVMPNAAFFIDIESVMEVKEEALLHHESQAGWLGFAQGFLHPVGEMRRMAEAVGNLSGHFRLAEGWRQHNHLGFCSEAFDPLPEVLMPFCVDNQDGD